LDQEGFGEAGAIQLTESFARHLMRALDNWQSDGFDGIACEYLGRLAREPQTAREIADNGDLITRRIGTNMTNRHDLKKDLLSPSWLDPKLGGPRL
jgi:hypothetical protein